jgi:hypothetical protein
MTDRAGKRTRSCRCLFSGFFGDSPRRDDHHFAATQ